MSKLIEHFRDIGPIVKKMTAQEKIWYRNFVLGYFGQNEQRLKAVCGDRVVLYHKLRSESRYMNHAHQRDVEGGIQRSYTSDDWVTTESVAADFADAVNEAMDAGISINSVL